MVIVPTAAVAADPAPIALPAVPGSESEPNDNAAAASPIASGERIRASVFPNADVDFYRFSAQAGDKVFASVMTSASASSSFDSQLTLLETDGATPIEFDDDNGTHGATSSSIAGATIPSAGTYFLKVNHKSPTGHLRPYDLYLQLRSGSPTAETEPNDGTGTADPLGNGFVSGTLNPAADADWYAISLNAGDTLALSLDLDPERNGTTFNGRLSVGLFGDGNNTALSADDAGLAEVPKTIPSEAQYITVRTAGTYYVLVDSLGGVGSPAATYQLSATVLPASQPSCRSYSSGGGAIPTGPGTLTLPIPVTDPARIGRAALAIDLSHTFMSGSRRDAENAQRLGVPGLHRHRFDVRRRPDPDGGGL